MIILKHYDNGVMLKLEDDKLVFVFPDGTTIRPTEEEADNIFDRLMTEVLEAHEGTKQ